MFKTRIFLLALLVIVVAFFVMQSLGMAEEAAPPSKNMIDSVYESVTSGANNWVEDLRKVGMRLFWYLVIISMVWTFGAHLMSGSFNIGAFFHEFIRFTCFVGFWKYMLDKGADFLNVIVTSFFNLGINTNSGGKIIASDVFWHGLELYMKIIDASANAGLVDKLLICILALVALGMIAVVAANLMISLCAGVILCYGGIFYFGFGGSRWTSDIAVNYLKSVLGIAINIFATLLLVNISTDVFTKLATAMVADDSIIGFQSMAAIAVAVVIMGMLVMKVPAQLAGIVSAPTGAISGVGMGLAMQAISGMAGAIKAQVQQGAAAGAAVNSARAKQAQNMAMGTSTAAAAGGGAVSRMLETGKILGSAAFANFKSGGGRGGISGMIDKAIGEDNKKMADKKTNDKLDTMNDKLDSIMKGGGTTSSNYVSSVPDKGGGGNAGFGGGSVGGGDSGSKRQSAQAEIDSSKGRVADSKVALT